MELGFENEQELEKEFEMELGLEKEQEVETDFEKEQEDFEKELDTEHSEKRKTGCLA